MSGKQKLSGTDLLHADDDVPRGLEVAPSISVTTSEFCGSVFCRVAHGQYITAFKQPDAWDPNVDWSKLYVRNPPRHVYSRYTQSVNTRAEIVLSKINVGSFYTARVLRLNVL